MKAKLGSAFINYWHSLQNDIPIEVYEGLVSVFCLASILILAFCGYKKSILLSLRLLLIEYVYLILCSTVLYRAYNESSGHNFLPLWSYEAIRGGSEEFITENIMNVVVFVPVGILLGIAFRSMTFWKVLLIGVAISSSIEVMQFFFKRGFAETDDVMHNTLGSMLGYGFCRLLMLAFRYAK